ncbi:unnamed protein product [Amoebophrya sp. A25]|nr:unnamed protein product [Amoebophrya sp. A25]|eukprot:GSA25T00015724001.1
MRPSTSQHGAAGSGSSVMNPLDYAAVGFWSFFRIFLIFVQSIFAPSKPSAVMNGTGKPGNGGGGPPGPRIHRIQPPMRRG